MLASKNHLEMGGNCLPSWYPDTAGYFNGFSEAVGETLLCHGCLTKLLEMFRTV